MSDMTQQVYYGKTPQGQLMYDLCFVTLTNRWIARKHGIRLAEVRKLREIPALKKLAKQVRIDRREKESNG